MSGLIVLFLLEIFMFIMAFALTGKDIMAPSVMMCVMFLISTLVAILNAEKWDICYSPDAVFLLASGIFCFIVSEAFFRYLFRTRESGVRKENATLSMPSYVVRPWKLNVIILFCVLVCFLQLRSVAQTSGANLSNGISRVFAANRYLRTKSLATSGGTVDVGILSQLTKLMYASGYLSSYLLVYNMVFSKRKWREQCKHLIIMLLSIVPSLMSSGRSTVLRLLCAIMIEYYIVWHQKYGWHRNLSWRYIRIGIIALIAGIPAFYNSAKLLGRTPSAPIFDYISAYLGASIQLFNMYVSEPVSRVILGEESLFSVIKVLHFLGLSEASTSYNLEKRFFSNGGSSNVYTFFRRPLHDFGILGMYIFTALIAMVFAYIYFRKIKQGRKRGCIGWVLIYGYLYYWIVVSSILQYSVAYISAGTCITVFFLLLLCKAVVRQRPAMDKQCCDGGQHPITLQKDVSLQNDSLASGKMSAMHTGG